MKVYAVGGSVRDALLGRPAGDRDWVVVGTTAQDMLDAGYTPVGRDFPVFLHPRTHEEYALARTERKTAPGYRGFVVHADPSVTLEEDLARRDLTVNAMAQDDEGRLLDPFGGERDLREGVLRHVSPAFAEDPVRILRLARFAARWPHFLVAAETLVLCRDMVAAGEVDALVAERVWQELSRGLMEGQPSRMLEVLRECGALARVLPEVHALYGVPQPAEHHPEVDTGVHLGLVLDQAAAQGAPLPVRWACLVHDLGKGTTPQAQWPRHIAHEARSVALARRLAERWRVPTDCKELGEIVAREHGNVHRSGDLDAAAVVRLLQRCDAWRRPERFEAALWACECDARGRTGWSDRPYPQRARLAGALQAGLAVDAAAVVAQAQSRGLSGPALADALAGARRQAIEGFLSGGAAARPDELREDRA
jgi:tRNA nucleotidyltransferase (CCA-adding enzyme)